MVLHRCETWSLAVREEHTLRVFENKVLRKIFGPKRDEVMGGWRNCKTRSFMICTLHKHNIMMKSRRMRWAGHVARMGEMRTKYRLLVGKPEGKRPPGRPRHRYVEILKWIF
jgi:hypothetical protein